MQTQPTVKAAAIPYPTAGIVTHLPTCAESSPFGGCALLGPTR